MPTFNISKPKRSRKIWVHEKFFFNMAISGTHKFLIFN